MPSFILLQTEKVTTLMKVTVHFKFEMEGNDKIKWKERVIKQSMSALVMHIHLQVTVLRKCFKMYQVLISNAAKETTSANALFLKKVYVLLVGI